MKKNIILLGALMLSSLAYSQVGINNEAPKATLDVTAKTINGTKPEGIIAPRLTGDQIKSGDTQYDTAQIGTIIYGTSAVTGTPAGKTINITSAGYYYFDNNLVWVKFGSGSSSSGTEPLYLENTTTEATANTQNIYQNGNVGIGNFAIAKPIAKLDVRGAVRTGTPHADELSGASAIGLNSVALGSNNRASGAVSVALGADATASGENSIAIGEDSKAVGYGSFAFGDATASGEASVAMGDESEASGDNSVAIGFGATASGEASIAMGAATTASSYYETTMGGFNAITTGTANTAVATDALLQVGNGDFGTPNNALTILKNAHTAIGVVGTEAVAKPTELLDLGGTATANNGGLRIRNINSTAYTSTVDADKIVVADANGVLKTKNSANLTTEPWQVQGTTDKATINTQDIYQTAKVSIGENPAIVDATLNVFNNDASAVAIPTYGIKNVMSSNSTASKYGFYNSLTTVAGASGNVIGSYNVINDNSVSGNFRGKGNLYDVNGAKASGFTYAETTTLNITPSSAMTQSDVIGTQNITHIGGNVTVTASARGNNTSIQTNPLAGSTTSIANSYGAFIGTRPRGAGTTNITNAHGVYGIFDIDGTGGFTYTSTNTSALTSATELKGAGTYTIGSLYGLNVSRVQTGSNTGTISNSYGVYIQRYRFAGDTPANAYNFYSAGADTKNYFQGRLGIGQNAPSAQLHIVKQATDLTPAIIEGCAEYTNNAAAVAAGLPIGALYRTATGVLMVRY